MQSAFIPGMRTGGSRSGLTPAHLAFQLLFPGFFFYQTLIGMGAMDAFLGGFFTAASFALLLPLLWSYFLKLRAAGYCFPRVDMTFGFFLSYFFLVVAINSVFGAHPTTVKNHLFSILYFINIFIVFRDIDFNDKKILGSALVSLSLMSAIILFFAEGGSFHLTSHGPATDEESLATYQGFARSYLFTFVAVICFTRHGWARAAWYLIAMLVLFLNGSRSELVAMLFLIPVVEIYRTSKKMSMIVFIVVAVAACAINLDYAMQLGPESRVWELAHLSQSDSSNARDHFALAAVSTIGDNPILGDYASYLPGQYAHNILSAWVDLGLFGFTYLLLMLSLPAIKLFFGGYFWRAKSGEFLLAFSLICITLLLLLTSKTFDDMSTGAAMGAYANYRSKRFSTVRL